MKFVIEKPVNLFQFLLEEYPDSPKTRIKKLLQNGNIKCNNKTVTLNSYSLKPGDSVEVLSHENKKIKTALNTPFPVLFEDEYLIIIEKPVGIATSSTDNSPNAYNLLSQFLKTQSKRKERIYVIHRLDKEVSGILLFAKSEAIMNTLKDNWKSVEKKYYALVEGAPKENEGTIKSWLIEDKFQKIHSTSQSGNSKYSITHFKVIRQLQNTTLLDIHIETGRKNQIRVHLSDIGCPIVGDRKYGASNEFVRRIRLHAYYLSLPHPVTGEIIKTESPLPKGFLVLKERNEDYK
jgi:23S rRNA pseudouridine1911/1915/1917 synthase